MSKFFSTCDSSRLSKSFVEIVEKVCEVSYESVSPGPEPSQTILQESPFGDSPNTIEHRNLVNRQLATLEHRMAHRQPQRDPSQPTFNVPHHFRQAVRRESVVSNMPVMLLRLPLLYDHLQEYYQEDQTTRMDFITWFPHQSRMGYQILDGAQFRDLAR